MRKIFISFLGTSNYLPCRYDNSDVVRFVQTSLVKKNDFDKVYVCCTKSAKDKNATPLSEEFKSNGLSAPKIVDVPNGESEEELWALFSTIDKLVEPNDSLYFDITHSYRSLPVLFSVLIQYLAVTKTTTLNRVVYGAFEALGPRSDVEAMLSANRNAPIFDLTPFFCLFDWSNAIHVFSEYGIAQPLCKLAKQEISPLLAKTKGKDESASALRCAVELLEKYTKACQFVRSDTIQSLRFRSNLLAKIDLFEQTTIPPLVPVLEKIKNRFNSFSDQDLFNGIRAAKWCASNGMIQQAYTLLQETIISVLSRDKRLTCIQHNDERQETVLRRGFISNLLNVVSQNLDESDWKEPLPDHIKLARQLASELKFISKEYAKLSAARNDINHGGTLKNAQKEASLEKQLSSLISFFEESLLVKVIPRDKQTSNI